MMCGKPILVSDNSSMARIVRHNNCGLVVPYGDVGAIKEAIVKLRLILVYGQNSEKTEEDPMRKNTLDNHGKQACHRV